MENQLPRKLLIVCNLAIWLSVVLVWQLKVSMLARPPMLMTIQSSPERVKIRLDLTYLFDKNYVQTPVEIKASPGKHKIKIIREGYVAHNFRVSGDAGDHLKLENIVLERFSGLSTVEIYTNSDFHTMYVELNDGASVGEAPIKFDDLIPGKEHLLRIFPFWPEKRDGFACRFTSTHKEIHTIELNAVEEKIHVTGCKRQPLDE